MSRPREKWWGYVKACIRDYPAVCQELETRKRAASDSGPARPTEWEALLHLEGEQVLQGQRAREFCGVRNAVRETAGLKDGPERLRMIEMVFWKRSHTLSGAALECHVSMRTARRWHGDFIRLAAYHMNLSD